MTPRPTRGLAVVLTGGGARAAFQAGFLRGLARRFPDLEIDVLSGVSAGAINIAFLASRRGTLVERTEALGKIWEGIDFDQVFRTGPLSLFYNVLRWGGRLLSGGWRAIPATRGMVDTDPLRDLLERELEHEDGTLTGIDRNLEEGRFEAVSISTTSYTTGQTITWLHGKEIRPWVRTHRIARECALSVSHVLASCSIPFFFPAVAIDGRYYGDGGIRLYAPLSPAVHLGATKILALSTRYAASPEESEQPVITGYPPLAQIGGTLFNAIFLDLIDADAVRLEQFNRLLRRMPEEDRGEMRPIDLMVVRPGEDIGRLAGTFEPKLPRAFRFLARGLGTRETRSNDFLSLVLFDPEYIRHLVDLGEQEFTNREESIAAFLATA